jgi:small subunit ribosomal protein S21
MIQAGATHLPPALLQAKESEYLRPFRPHSRRRGSATRGKIRLSEVIIHDDENVERALKRFKKKCEKAGILSDLRKHRHYEKPSERRKRKMNAAMRKNRRTRSA